MLSTNEIKNILRTKKREFTAKRGRMGRSPFFANAFIVAALAFIYIVSLRHLVFALDEVDVPRVIYSNVYFVGVGLLFLGIALLTRPLRLKRIRDMGLPVWVDWPFFLLLIGHGLGPIFRIFNIPYLSSVEVIGMPAEVRDLFGIIWLVWLLVLVLAPSRRRKNFFECPEGKAQAEIE